MTTEPRLPDDEPAQRGATRALWRSLAERESLANGAGGAGAATAPEPWSPVPWSPEMGEPERRDVLKLLGATAALAGVGACTRQPDERILPYARSPERLVPGVPVHYATNMPWASGAVGLLVESHMGRPTKIEGNPEHPGSLGATDAFAQGAVLSLVDPERSKVTLHAGRIETFAALREALQQALAKQESRAGEGLRILTRSVTSPTLHGLLRSALERFPRARWVQYEAAHRDAARAGALRAFGQDVVPRVRFDKARCVVSLGADFLGAGPASVVAARNWADARQHGGLRTWVAESCASLSGARADSRVAISPPQMAALAGWLARSFGLDAPGPELEGELADWAERVRAELASLRGASVLLAGDSECEEVHALVHALNQELGNVGSTVTYGDPTELEPSDQGRALAHLVEDMNAGEVQLLVVLGANPCYEAPGRLDFAAALARVETSVHCAPYVDETAVVSLWHTPEAHFLESWGDARAADGTVGIVQPLIAPLYDGHSSIEVAAILAGAAAASGHDLVREHWRTRLPDPDGVGFERAWRRALHDGLVRGTGAPARSVAWRPAVVDVARAAQSDGGLSGIFRPDSSVHDGRFAENAWLQECPRPLSKVVWDNGAWIAPRTARRLGLRSGDVVRLSVDARSVRIPVLEMPGQAEDTLVLPLGYGRRAGASGALGVGTDVGPLRHADSTWTLPGLALERTSERHAFAATQEHHSMEGRDLVRVWPEERAHPAPSHEGDAGEGHAGGHAGPSLYPPVAYPGHAWGMAIDLDRCTGCSACVVACQAENNIPVVGKREVARGREMHWLRIDRYWEGDPFDDRTEPLRTHFQPVPCMHCEVAPCEVVCPVGATVHSDEGLNDMVYNRCVGTRYCSNNCPYKVRRFNFFRYADFDSESLKLQRNPNVTIRSRGVMEKCTYCVQRISAGRIRSRREGRPLADGEVRTACQSVCPAQAITFGDQNDASSAVAQRKAEARNYALLEELNTRPRTTYLAKWERTLASGAHAGSRDAGGSREAAGSREAGEAPASELGGGAR